MRVIIPSSIVVTLLAAILFVPTQLGEAGEAGRTPTTLFSYAAVGAAAPQKNFCANGGFESDKEHWRGRFSIDHEVRHSGRISARCHNVNEYDESIVSQTVVLNQSAAIPIVVSGWSKAEKVSGRRDIHYSLWCDVEYQNDIRPGRVDDWHITSFDIGTHDWQYIETIFNPKYPIKHINFHAIFRRTHKGTVWFDDLSIRPLSDGPLAGAAEDVTPLKADDPIAAMFRKHLQTGKGDDILVSIRDITEKGRARGTLRCFLGDEPSSNLLPPGSRELLRRLPLQYPPTLTKINPTPPYAWLRLFRNWEVEKMIIEAADDETRSIEWYILLPKKIAIRKIALENWEAREDTASLHSLDGRLLIHLVTNINADHDGCVVFLNSQESKVVEEVGETPKLQSLTTQDGLSLGIGDDGRIWTTTIGKEDATSTEVKKRPFGLLIGDMFQGKFSSGQTTLKRDGEQVNIHADYKGIGLQSNTIYDVKEDHISVSGTIEDKTGHDRAVDLLFRLPIGGEGWKWWNDIATASIIGPDFRHERDDLTFACITDGEAEKGIGIALSPDIPCRFKIGFDSNESLLYLRCKYALVKEAKLSGGTKFAFSIFRVDGKWGMRDAARRYYSVYPQAFRRRAMKEGAWLFAINPKKVPNPEDYGYYEGGPAMAEFNKSKGILTLPYIIPGQRSITYLPRLPKSYDDAMAEFDEFKQPPQDHWGPRLKRMIENCRVVEANGKFPIRIRDDVGADIKPKHPINMVVFSVNCDPDLFADKPNEPTVARFELSKVKKLIEKYPLIGGIYVDSTSGWVSRTMDFRRDHFPYTDSSLTYEDATGRPAIDGRFLMFEFLHQLGKLLHPSNRLVFPNLGCSRRVCWLYFVTDVVGLEGRAIDVPTLRYCRTLAYQKPTLRLDYVLLGNRKTRLAKRKGFELFFKRCTLYGIYPSIGRYCDKTYEQFSDVYKTYMPILRKLGAAGWEPITYASINDDEITIERFGPNDGEMFFTLYNESNREKEVNISLDLDSIGLKKIVSASELVTGTNFDAASRISLSLHPDELKVIALEVK